MSPAPLFCLRSLWANGGAPAAFVRRDAQLADTIAHITRTAATAEDFGTAESFARLLATVDFAGLFGAEDDASAGNGTVAAAPREPRRAHPHAAFTHEAAATPRERVGHAAATQESATRADHATTQSAHARASAPRARDSHIAPDATRATPPTSAHAPAASASAHGARTSADAHDADNARVHAQSPLRRTLDASRPNWRQVGVIREQHGANEMSGLADILARVNAPPMHDDSAAAENVRTREDHPRRAADIGSVVAQVGRAVQRIEQQRQQERRDRRSEQGTDLQPDNVVEPGRVIVRTTAHQASALGNADIPEPAPRAVGLRGLVERSGPVRAAFFGATAQYVDQAGPQTDFDRVSELLDDAARREGVDLEESV